MRPTLFLLKLPFTDDDGNAWFCTHCAMIEGALAVNPHWAEHVDIHRIGHAKPRAELVERLGEENQWLPVLIVEPGEPVTDPVAITDYLARTFGGARPHP